MVLIRGSTILMRESEELRQMYNVLRDEMVHRSEFEDVLGRVRYIEKKLGIESGV
jgi:hypothetical protein